jgi:hypothetical protein
MGRQYKYSASPRPNQQVEAREGRAEETSVDQSSTLTECSSVSLLKYYSGCHYPIYERSLDLLFDNGNAHTND